MIQLALFSTDAARTTTGTSRGTLDVTSERLLSTFQARRLAAGTHPQSVRREVSQLRAVAREAGTMGRPACLNAIVADLARLADVLREPKTLIARSTGRARLLAIQRFITVMADELGRDAASDLTILDGLLPARRSAGWHTTGALMAGATGRRRRRGPTLDATDLRRIVDAVQGSNHGDHGDKVRRDRALIALHCFSGLHPEEIVRLRWENLEHELTLNGRYGLTAGVVRRGNPMWLLLPAPAAEAIENLVASTGRPLESLTGPVFLARGASGRALSYRAARAVIENACRLAGLPVVETASFRSACAHWLRSQGLSDHEVASVLGLARVKSVDRLLRRHTALGAQRTVREVLGR